MPRSALRFIIPVMGLLAASCSVSPSSGDAGRLLVDRDARRYGRVVSHSRNHVIPIKRGDGVTELFVPVRVG
ncbi:MAG: hypothetical protein GWO24_37945, partial [Akkermansiaceae bacterium]|nr:hypothetical protein [Akkermansiaceae bacterium]